MTPWARRPSASAAPSTSSSSSPRRFDGVPWLERVHQCGALWDAAEMGDHADVHCYTPEEFERKRESLPLVRRVSDHGVDLLAA